LYSIVFLAGCATTTSDVGQVREVAPGTYKIGVGGGAASAVFGITKRRMRRLPKRANIATPKDKSSSSCPPQGEMWFFAAERKLHGANSGPARKVVEGEGTRGLYKFL
jgi:hypothetical protein